ncbi:predicted protein [Chaetomium globosum CBS 148.51]|uniref:Uncharacterized protein n=1 Tax=Chaetomium globosum (strain ATCC 6205 / CBS 148.51 / DSM 1962 / NBRC 6347 / NRRL 1970) TaxID=306901 RepID=Q2GN87_CHAGB|nr:uncharacterized protein CHGG_10567 [Chaetomium globosum CBS 148.51]EAQ84163.1 predicted protein [Chaetomium globosum CBS 148.51]
MHPARTTFVALQPPSLPGAGEPETVIITVKPAEDEADPFAVIGFDITLTEDSELRIKPRRNRINLVLLSTKLMRRAAMEVDQCRALLGNRKRCQLRRNGRDWCPVHREYHQFLHNGELNDRKHLYEQLELHQLKPRTASLALRIMVTEILYAGDEDDNHGTFFHMTKQNRANLSQQLSWNRSDGSNRRPISTFIDDFLAAAREREGKPESRSVWADSAVVNLADVRTMQAFQTQSRYPSVSELFGAAGSLEMRNHLLEKARLNGDLPDLPPRPTPQAPVVVKPLTEEEEREYWVKRGAQCCIDTSDW